jgi:hypothetical protein
MALFLWASSLTRGRVWNLYMLLALASVVFLGSEFLWTRNHILLTQIWDFPLRRLLRLAGSRWSYSTPPPHPAVTRYIIAAPTTKRNRFQTIKNSLLLVCRDMSHEPVAWKRPDWNIFPQICRTIGQNATFLPATLFLILTQYGKIREVKLYHSRKDSYAGTYTHTFIHFYVERCVVSCMNVTTDCPWIGFMYTLTRDSSLILIIEPSLMSTP